MSAATIRPNGTAVLALGPVSFRIAVRPLLVSLALLVVLLVAIVAAVAASVNAPIPIDRVLTAALGTGTPADELIVGEIRLPRVLAAAFVGAALGIGGGIFQSVTRNPLGSPDVIGFNSGATTGALIAMLVLDGGAFATAIGAVLGGAITAVLVFALSSRGGVSPLRLVLVGIGGGAALAAVNQLLIVRSQIYDAQSASIWLIGNLAGRGWAEVSVLAPLVAVGLVLAAALSRPLTMGEFSDDRAASLGLNPGRVRILAVALAVVLSSGAVAAAGPILFIALAAPQIARRLTRVAGPSLISSSLVGSLLLVVADFGAREAFQPRQLPVGVLTGVVGGIYLAWLLGREWRRGRA